MTPSSSFDFSTDTTTIHTVSNAPNSSLIVDLTFTLSPGNTSKISIKKAGNGKDFRVSDASRYFWTK